jgi:hypothetical protein
MTLAEALAALELAGGEDARTARRAYLRAVKRNKPERDPDGFRRVREAWEQVEAWVAVVGAVPRLEPESGEAATLAEPEPPFEPPAEPESPPGREPAIVVSLFPPDSARMRVGAAHDHLEAGRFSDALAAAEDLFELGVTELPAGPMLDLALAFFEARRPREGSALLGRFGPWLEDRGGEVRGLRAHHRLTWVFARELPEYAAFLPPLVLEALAAGLRRGSPHPEAALVLLVRQARAQPAWARALLRRLADRAPTTAPLLRPALQAATFQVRYEAYEDERLAATVDAPLALGADEWGWLFRLLAALVVFALVLAQFFG